MIGSFVFGGFLPGTNIQFSFQAWLVSAVLLLGLFLATRLTNRHLFNLPSPLLRSYAPYAQDLHWTLESIKPSLDKLSVHRVGRGLSGSLIAHKARSYALGIYLLSRR